MCELQVCNVLQHFGKFEVHFSGFKQYIASNRKRKWITLNCGS